MTVRGITVAPTCTNCNGTDFVWANELKTGGLSGSGTLSLRGRGEIPLGTRICRTCGHAELFLRDISILHQQHMWRPGEFIPIVSKTSKPPASHHTTHPTPSHEPAPAPTPSVTSVPPAAPTPAPPVAPAVPAPPPPPPPPPPAPPAPETSPPVEVPPAPSPTPLDDAPAVSEPEPTSESAAPAPKARPSKKRSTRSRA